MKSVHKFNALNGCKEVSREEIEKLLNLAIEEDQVNVVQRLSHILEAYPEAETFNINTSYSAIETVPNFLTGALPYEQFNDETEALNKAVTTSQIYDMITNKMVSLLKEATGTGYKKKWKGQKYGKGYLIPFNFVSKKSYRGINNFLLRNPFEPLKNPFFMTLKQVEELGGKIKKGTHGFEVVYFTKLYKIDIPKDAINFGSYDLQKVKNFTKEKGIDENKITYLPILKYYKVFNGNDIEGIDFDLDNFKIGYIENELPSTEENKIEIAELIIKNYPTPQPKLRFGGNDAYYSPSGDYIQMPQIVDFKTIQDYYRTLFHEFSHSTGNYNRLNRNFSGKFGSKPYAFEELVAEWGAVFLSAEAGIIWHDNKNHAEYLKNWNNVLTQLKDDNKFVMRACTKAQELCDFVLQSDDNGTPLYMKELKEKIKKDAQTPKKLVNKVVKTPKKNTKTTRNAKTDVPTAEPKVIISVFTTSELKDIQQNGGCDFADFQKKINTYNELKTLLKGKLTPEKKEIYERDILKLNEYFTNCKNLEKKAPVKKNNPIYKKTKPLNAIPLVSNVIGNMIANAVLGEPAPAKNSIAEQMKQRATMKHEYYSIPNKDIANFLGTIEKKSKDSVAITITAPQGAMKTRFCFQLMNAFAQNYQVGHASIEEHPASKLYFDKVEQYLNTKATHNVSAPEINSIDDVHKLCRENDVIVIDSFSKLQEMQHGCELDKDFRKAYHGKLFIIIYQQTSDGKMRGGSKSQFDGDCVAFIEKKPNYQENYVYWNKNRYQDKNLEDLKFNIYSGKLQAQEQPEEIKFSFNIK